MKPRLGIMHYSYPPVVGGVETVIKQQAHLFADHGFSVTLVMGEGATDRQDIKITLIPQMKSLRNINTTLYQQILDQKDYPPGFDELSKEIYGMLESSLKDLDIIIIHDMLTLKFNVAFNMAMRQYISVHHEKKYIAWTQDISLDEDSKRFVFVNDKLDQLLYTPVPGVYYIAVSNYLKNSLEQLIGFPKDLARVIPNAIPIAEYLNLQPITKSIIERRGLLDADPLIFIPSKMMPHKNIDICIKVLSELKPTYPNAKIVISARAFHHNSDNDYIWKIDSMIHELGLDKDVIIVQDELNPGANDYEVLKDLYKICDVVFFLSSYENFGLPILESGITRAPIICNDLQVFHELSAANIYFTNISRPPHEVAKFVDEVINSQKTGNLFREIKRRHGLETVFKNQMLPFIERISTPSISSPSAPASS